MEEFYKERFVVTYSCGCKHEIGRNMAGAWQATGNEVVCPEHNIS